MKRRQKSTRMCMQVRSRRRGSTVVEFAVILPIMLTIVFGIIEFGWMFMVRQTAQNAAREGCRLAVLKSTTAPYTDVTDRVMTMVQPIGVTPGIVMTHATDTIPYESVTVTIAAADVSLMGGYFGSLDYDIVGQCSMRKEGMDAE